MNDHSEISAAEVVASLAFDRTSSQLRLAIGGCGLFFAAVFTVGAVATCLATDPASAIWVIPVSLALSAGITIAFAKWGALSMMMLVADEHSRVRAVFGASGVRRLSKKLGDRAYLRKEFLLGGIIVVAYLLIAVLVALSGLGVNGATAFLALPMFWLGTGVGIFMIRAALKVRPSDTPLESTVAAPLVAAYLQEHDCHDELTSGIPADVLVSSLSDSDMANVASVAVALAHIRKPFDI